MGDVAHLGGATPKTIANRQVGHRATDAVRSALRWQTMVLRRVAGVSVAVTWMSGIRWRGGSGQIGARSTSIVASDALTHCSGRAAIMPV